MPVDTASLQAALDALDEYEAQSLLYIETLAARLSSATTPMEEVSATASELAAAEAQSIIDSVLA